MAFARKSGQTSLEEARTLLLGQRDALNALQLTLTERETELAAREVELAARETELALRAEQFAAAPPADPDTETLARLEARLAELHEAEKSFQRTRDELAGRSEAVAARERLVAQRERLLDDPDDGTHAWSGPELTELEARLRKLEQREPGDEKLGFSGGLRKLEQGTRPPRRD